MRLTIDQLKAFFEPLGIEVWALSNKSRIHTIALYRRRGLEVVQEYEWTVKPGNPTVHIDTVKHAISTMKRKAA